MSPDSEYPKRRQARIRDFDYSTPGAYFITICTKNFKPILGRIENDKMILTRIGQIVDDCLNSLNNEFENIELDYFTIMPNHIHAILNFVRAGSAGPKKSPPLGKIVAHFKYISTKKCYRNSKQKLWHRNYHEHVIRNENDLTRIREYIINNPLKWTLDKYYAADLRARRPRPYE